jgi:DNA-binding ferritin-like protein
MEALKRPTKSAGCEILVFNLLNSVTIIHLAHLGITGPGSYAAHKALNEYYDEIGDFVDSVVEHYQGITGKLMRFPSQAIISKLSSAEECCGYLKSLRADVDREQAVMPYSEINNVLDEIKSLIDSTCYKLTFLK